MKRKFSAQVWITTVAVLLLAASARGDVGHARLIDRLWQNDTPYFTRFTATDHPLVDLAGTWKFATDPEDEGRADGWFEPGFDDSSWFDHPVPGSWNAQKPEWLYYQGSGWYRRSFSVPAEMKGRLNRLVFDGTAFFAEVWLNGRPVGSHRGGFSQWSIDVSDDLRGGESNTIAIRVDNRRDFDHLPPLTGSLSSPLGWWFYGGINRMARLESSPRLTAAIFHAGAGADGSLRGGGSIYNATGGLARGEAIVTLRDLSGAAVQEISRTKFLVERDDFFFINFDGRVSGVSLWSPTSPANRYLLELKVTSDAGAETQSVEIGFRTFEFRGVQPYLNGKPIWLRGINRHEDDPAAGPVQTDEVIARDIALLKKLHVNFIRGAHYPSDPRWLDACDRAGILVVEEIPLYQVAGSGDSGRAAAGEEMFRDAARELSEMIQRDRNHPSIVMWSVGNECNTMSWSIRRFHQRLYDLAKRFDPGRPVTFAISTAPVATPLLDVTAGIGDVLFLNCYFGWYHSRVKDLGPFLDSVHARWPGKPVVVSEFGAGSVIGKAEEPKFKIAGKWHGHTEEFQAEFYRAQMAQILDRPWICGTMPWAFADFRDDKRKTDPIPDFNIKGLLDYERKPKQAFGVIEEIYAGIEAKYGW